MSSSCSSCSTRCGRDAPSHGGVSLPRPPRPPDGVGTTRSRKPVQQTLGAVGLDVAPDLVELLARVAHYLAGPTDVIELLGQLQQRELAPCYLVLRGLFRLLVRVWMKVVTSSWYTPQGRHDHASQRGQLSGEYDLRTSGPHESRDRDSGSQSETGSGSRSAGSPDREIRSPRNYPEVRVSRNPQSSQLAS